MILCIRRRETYKNISFVQIEEDISRVVFTLVK